MKSTLLFAVFTALLFGCGRTTVPQKVTYNANAERCKVAPPFLRKLGYNANQYAFSTSHRQLIGLTLGQVSYNGNDPKAYQHPSWRMGGTLNKIIVDEKGNIYVAPSPNINVLNNPIDQQTTIYRVNGQTGEMAAWLVLPQAVPPNEQNPYGLLSLAYSCEQKVLYAASVFGSSRQKEVGAIYAIDVEKKEVIATFSGVDPFGMTITSFTGERRLYFGKARELAIYSVLLDENGQFIGKMRKELSLEGKGPRGDDKVRTLSLTPENELQVHGIEFNFNLIAPTEKQENIYKAHYNKREERWEWNEDNY